MRKAETERMWASEWVREWERVWERERERERNGERERERNKKQEQINLRCTIKFQHHEMKYLFQYHQQSCNIQKIEECSDEVVPLFLRNWDFHPSDPKVESAKWKSKVCKVSAILEIYSNIFSHNIRSGSSQQNIMKWNKIVEIWIQKVVADHKNYFKKILAEIAIE